jgi:hypothetical protein
MQRINGLTGRDVMVSMMLARTMAKLIEEKAIDKAQAFLAFIWNLWREPPKDGPQAQGYPGESIGHFFDFYFHTYGDFARIDAMLAAAIPEEHKQNTLETVAKATEKNLKMVRATEFEQELSLLPKKPDGMLLN